MKQYAVTCVLFIDALDESIAEELALELLDNQYRHQHIVGSHVAQTEEINEQE